MRRPAADTYRCYNIIPPIGTDGSHPQPNSLFMPNSGIGIQVINQASRSPAAYPAKRKVTSCSRCHTAPHGSSRSGPRFSDQHAKGQHSATSTCITTAQAEYYTYSDGE